ncbi:hypothetical protein FB451DRAFT_1403525 [Mycena latifolia]|nr:hypothetical protein FB451DRAFT_1403525 [Mycena latifolia]
MISTSKFLVPLALVLATLGALQKTDVVGTVFQIVPDKAPGACGWTNTSTQAVGAVSNTTFKSFPGATANPNKNPICHHFMNITGPPFPSLPNSPYADLRVPALLAHGVTVSVQIVDFFKQDPNAGPNDVGIPVMEFAKMAPVRDGIIKDATWVIL